MTPLHAEPWFVDMIVAFVAIEGLILIAWRARTGAGLPVAATLTNLSSGASLLLALRAALSGASATSILIFLAVALVAHVADLAGRSELRRRVPRTSLRARMIPGS